MDEAPKPPEELGDFKLTPYTDLSPLGDPLQELEDNGFAILPQAAGEAFCSELNLKFQVKLDETLLNPPPMSFSKIMNRSNRHDLRLQMEPQVRELISRVVRAHPEIYQNRVSNDGILIEMGFLTSFPGAERQVIHSDVTFSDEVAQILTTWVALQDVDETMGPTWIWPGTHSAYFQTFYKPIMNGPVDKYYWETEHCEMTVKCGDVVLMDTRVMHCGGPNFSQKRRAMFHFSFKTVDFPNVPEGFTYHLHPALQGKFTLADFL